MRRVPRLAVYGAVSTLGASAVVSSAVRNKPNFYTAAVSIGQSSGALMVLANFMLFNVICIGVGIKTVFFGRLRRVEYEHLFERLWIFLTESLLAMTIFREDFSVSFAVMFGLLVFIKCFHWITADRVDYMDQVPPPGPTPLFHARTLSIILLLLTIDTFLILYCLESILYDGISAMILFASEFMILFATISGIAAKYTINSVDQRRSNRLGEGEDEVWREKGGWVFYVELGVGQDFLKLLTYLVFFLAILLSYGLPLHILRDVYMTARQFLSRVQDLIRYRRATKDMENLYPNAKHEELTRQGDAVCIICREEMVAFDAPLEGIGADHGETDGAGVGAGGNAQDAAAGGPAPVPDQSSAPATLAPTGPTRSTQRQAPPQNPNEIPKKLQCGHIFHFHCLRSWLERQQSCPTCRRDVLRPAPADLGANRRRPVNANAPFPPGPLGPDAPLFPPRQNDERNADTQVPPAPAPSQAARPDNVPRPTFTAQQNEAATRNDAARAMYEQFFRFPNSANPPTRTGNGQGRVNAEAGPGPSTVQAQMQAQQGRTIGHQGIWGGPVEIGRFFVPPLGAAPRLGLFDHRFAPRYGNSVAQAGEDKTDNGVQIPSGIGGRARHGVTDMASVPVQISEQAAARPVDTRTAQPGTPGLHTPHYSNPPEVFRSLSDSRPRPPIPDPANTADLANGLEQSAGPGPAVPEVAIHDEDEEEVEDEDEFEVEQMTEEERRRAVAEATARRLGIKSTAHAEVSNEVDMGKGKAIGKGKGKGKERAIPNPLDLTPRPDQSKAHYSSTSRPYLSLPAGHLGLGPNHHVSTDHTDGIGSNFPYGQDGELELSQTEEDMARMLSVALDQTRHAIRSSSSSTDVHVLTTEAMGPVAGSRRLEALERLEEQLKGTLRELSSALQEVRAQWAGQSGIEGAD